MDCQSLVLVPTHELAHQVDKVMRALVLEPAHKLVHQVDKGMRAGRLPEGVLCLLCVRIEELLLLLLL